MNLQRIKIKGGRNPMSGFCEQCGRPSGSKLCGRCSAMAELKKENKALRESKDELLAFLNQTTLLIKTRLSEEQWFDHDWLNEINAVIQEAEQQKQEAK